MQQPKKNRQKERRGWQWCRTFTQLIRVEQDKLAKDEKSRATYFRIAELHYVQGTKLDALGAPLRVIRWIAWSPDSAERPRNFVQMLRFNAALRFHEKFEQWPLDVDLAKLAKTLVPGDSPPEDESGLDTPAEALPADLKPVPVDVSAVLIAACAISLREGDPEFADKLMTLAIEAQTRSEDAHAEAVRLEAAAAVST